MQSYEMQYKSKPEQHITKSIIPKLELEAANKRREIIEEGVDRLAKLTNQRSAINETAV